MDGLQWETKEENYLKDNWVKCGPEYIAHKLGRTEYAVKAKAKRLGLSKNRRGGYSENDLSYIKNNAGDLTAREIARALNRSTDSIHQKAMRLGVSMRVRHD